MSKIEDETARGVRQRSSASASVDDGAVRNEDVDGVGSRDGHRNGAPRALDDLDDEPVVVPANDDWSVDDDDPVSGRANGTAVPNGTVPNPPSPAEWTDQQLPGFEALTSNGDGADGSRTTRTPKVKRFVTDHPDQHRTALRPDEDRPDEHQPVAHLTVDNSRTDQVDVSVDRATGVDTGQVDEVDSSSSSVGDPLIAPSVARPVEELSSTGPVPIIPVDDEPATGKTGPVPIVIHEQTVVDPSQPEARTPVVDRDDVDHAFDDPWGDGWTEAGPGVTQSNTAVMTYGQSASVPVPAVQPETARRRRVRRVNRVLRHVDPWSVFKVGLLFNGIGYLVAMTSGYLLWDVASRTGTLPNIERWATQFGWETFELDGGAIFRNAAVAGLFFAVGMTGAMVMFATVFNLVSDAIGGIRVTVLEEEVVAVVDEGSVVTPEMTTSLHHQGTDNWAIEDF